MPVFAVEKFASALLAASRVLLALHAVAVLAAISSQSAAQGTDDLYEISLRLVDELYGEQVEIDGCPEYLGPTISGREVIFLCRSREVYEIRMRDRSIWGYQTLRVPKEQARGAPDRPLPGPIRIIQIASDRGAAEAAFSLLADDRRPSDAEPFDEANVAAASKPALLEELSTLSQAPASSRSPYALLALSPELRGFSLNTSSGTLKLTDPPIDGREVWTWTPTLTGLVGPVMFSVAEAPSCRMELSAENLLSSTDVTELALSCSMVDLDLVNGLRPRNGACRETPQGWQCLLGAREDRIDLQVADWTNTVAVLGPDRRLRLSLDQIRPVVPLRNDLDTGVTSGPCAHAPVSVTFDGYCPADGACLSAGISAESIAIPDAGVTLGPSLADAGWDRPDAVPIAIRVSIAFGNEAPVSAISRFSDPPLELSDASQTPSPMRRLPLVVELGEGAFAPGRELRVFSDTDCTNPVSSSTKSLFFAGTVSPEVPACGHFQIFDGERPRSSCRPLEINNELNIALAKGELASCGDRRIVLVVVENTRSGGKMGQSIERSIEDFARQAHASEACLPVDVVRTIGADREILLSGEDLRLADDFDAIWNKVRFSFLNSESQPFEDFSWIERIWGDTLGGVVFILDASQPRPASPLDAPAAVLWFANNIYRQVLNTAGQEGCDDYRSILRIENCEDIADGLSAVALAGFLDTALANIGKTK